MKHDITGFGRIWPDKPRIVDRSGTRDQKAVSEALTTRARREEMKTRGFSDDQIEEILHTEYIARRGRA